MQKKEIRKIALTERMKLTEEQVQSFSHKILENLVAYFDFSDLQTIHTFLPISSKNEPNTLLIINELKLKYPHLKFVISKADFTNNTLQNYYYDPSKIAINNYGIPEPTGGDICETEAIDLVLVPLLAYDNKGYRVGYGKGFYDKFLSTCHTNVITVGIAFTEPIAHISDLNEHDIPLQFVVNPQKILKI